MRAKDILQYGVQVLSGQENAQFDALEILKLATGCEKYKLLSDYKLNKKQIKKYNRLLKKRKAHLPLDAIIGYTDFNNIIVKYNKKTLTPRKETERLAEMVVLDLKASCNQNPSVLDICCGSGCIGVSIAKSLIKNEATNQKTESKKTKNIPENKKTPNKTTKTMAEYKNTTPVQVDLADISRHALAHTRHTAQLNNVQVNIIKSDMFNNITKKYDIIVCNPPYIDKLDMQKLEKEVKNHDPKLALFGGCDGLDFYKILASDASKHLHTGGKLFLELDSKNAKTIAQLFYNYEKVEIIKDYYGHDRFLVATV